MEGWVRWIKAHLLGIKGVRRWSSNVTTSTVHPLLCQEDLPSKDDIYLVTLSPYPGLVSEILLWSPLLLMLLAPGSAWTLKWTTRFSWVFIMREHLIWFFFGLFWWNNASVLLVKVSGYVTLNLVSNTEHNMTLPNSRSCKKADVDPKQKHNREKPQTSN